MVRTKGADDAKAIIDERRGYLEERIELNCELRNLVGLIMTKYGDLTKGEADEIAQILIESRKGSATSSSNRNKRKWETSKFCV